MIDTEISTEFAEIQLRIQQQYFTTHVVKMIENLYFPLLFYTRAWTRNGTLHLIG